MSSCPYFPGEFRAGAAEKLDAGLPDGVSIRGALQGVVDREAARLRLSGFSVFLRLTQTATENRALICCGGLERYPGQNSCLSRRRVEAKSPPNDGGLQRSFARALLVKLHTPLYTWGSTLAVQKGELSICSLKSAIPSGALPWRAFACKTPK